MSNDLTELTNTELDAVCGGKGLFALNFGNIVTEVNSAEQTGAVVTMGAHSSATLTQSLAQSNNIGTVGSSFSDFSFRM